MNEMTLYKTYFLKILISMKSMLSKPTLVYYLVPTVSFALLSNLQLALLLMFTSFFLDFFTGILASWMEQKNNPKEIKVYLIESAKLRKSVVKAITYALFILLVYFIEKIFFIKMISIESISSQKLTITIIAVAFCLAIEFFSVIENLKRAGFDLIGSFKKMVKNIKNIIATVKS
jgi:phosphatidylserine synthase